MASEKRLIDANALGIGRAKREAFDDPAYADGWNSAIAIIENAPTVDAVEVVHGHWFLLDECANAGVYCSVCHKKVYKEDYAWCNRKNKLRSNYCPNCGAKMDGDWNG